MNVRWGWNAGIAERGHFLHEILDLELDAIRHPRSAGSRP